jgi:hypothetical protein
MRNTIITTKISGHFTAIAMLLTSLLAVAPVTSKAQSLPRRQNDAVPAQVEGIYKRGLRYLSVSQQADGSWGGGSGSRPAVVGLCLLAFLAHGDDPNYGPYADNIRKSINYIIEKHEEGKDGYMGPQMYDHGFATLALAECYGVVDDKRIAPALEKCVKLILSAQSKNPRNGWRYSPDSRDADCSVAGCQIVALLAARNAGIPVPDKAIDQGLGYLTSIRSSSSGSYGYTSRSHGKTTLTAIGSLCFSLAKKKDEHGYSKSLEHLRKNINDQGGSYPFYFRYYMAQALFQADEELWETWNKNNIRLLSATQLPDGSFAGKWGNPYCTSAALLSLAVNYRFLPIYEK